MGKSILLVSTADTKGPEMLYLKERIADRGHPVLLIDVSCTTKERPDADISNEEVAKASDTSMSKVAKMALGDAVDIMSKGLVNIVKEIFEKDMLKGIVGIGGGDGSSIVSPAMQILPVGVPKLLVSSKIAGEISGASYYIGVKDLTLMYTFCDIAGLNRVTKKILNNAAGAIVGMVEIGDIEIPENPVVALTMMVTPCGLNVYSAVENLGHEVVIFPTTGPGGTALEEFIESDKPMVVLDLSLREIGDYLFGGAGSSGPARLTTAGKMGIPQVVATGNVDFIAFPGPKSVPPEYKDRKLNFRNPTATQMRLNADEMKKSATVIAQKLNNAKGPVHVLIPTRGFSAYDHVDGPFYDPEADQIFIDILMGDLNKEIPVSLVDNHVNDPEFSQAVVQVFQDVMEKN